MSLGMFQEAAFVVRRHGDNGPDDSAVFPGEYTTQVEAQAEADRLEKENQAKPHPHKQWWSVEER
jgi:hypothetical protein